MRINNSKSKFTFSNETSFDDNLSDDNNNEDRETQNWKSDEIDFFDSEYEDVNNALIINVDKHVFYRNVYAFTDKLKNIALLRDENKFRIIISQCLRKSVLIWHFMKLFDVEKLLLRNAFVNSWTIVLIIRFKKHIPITLLRF